MVIEDYSKSIEIWGWDAINKKIFIKNRISCFSNDEIIVNMIYNEELNDFIFQTNKNLVSLSDY